VIAVKTEFGTTTKKTLFCVCPVKFLVKIANFIAPASCAPGLKHIPLEIETENET